MAAIPITTSKFGPSGSLKNKNSILEHTIAVMPKISSELFFDLKNIAVCVLSLTQSKSLKLLAAVWEMLELPLTVA